MPEQAFPKPGVLCYYRLCTTLINKRKSIASAIIAFCNCNHMFHADDLRRFVGLVNYRVVNRHQSLYEVLPLDSSPEL